MKKLKVMELNELKKKWDRVREKVAKDWKKCSIALPFP